MRNCHKLGMKSPLAFEVVRKPEPLRYVFVLAVSVTLFLILLIIITECETIIEPVDATTNDFLAEVTVTYSAAGQLPVTFTTVEYDNANLGSLKIGFTYDIMLEKEGYDSLMESIVIGAFCEVPISMALNPKTINGTGRIVLSWQKDEPSDLDIHLKSDDECHVHYDDEECGGNTLDNDQQVKSALIIYLILNS